MRTDREWPAAFLIARLVRTEVLAMESAMMAFLLAVMPTSVGVAAGSSTLEQRIVDVNAARHFNLVVASSDLLRNDGPAVVASVVRGLETGQCSNMMSAVEGEALSHVNRHLAVLWAFVPASLWAVMPALQSSGAVFFAVDNLVHMFRVARAAALVPALQSVPTDQLATAFRRLSDEVIGAGSVQRRIGMPGAA
jgi:hypothetical protein